MASVYTLGCIHALYTDPFAVAIIIIVLGGYYIMQIQERSRGTGSHSSWRHRARDQMFCSNPFHVIIHTFNTAAYSDIYIIMIV